MLYFKPLFYLLCLLCCAHTHSYVRTYKSVFLSLLRLLVAAAFIYLQTVQQRHLCSSIQCCIPHTLYLYDQSLLSQQFRSRVARLEGENVTTTLPRLGSYYDPMKLPKIHRKNPEQSRKKVLPEGALGKVFVILDSSDHPEGPISLTA